MVANAQLQSAVMRHSEYTRIYCVMMTKSGDGVDIRLKRPAMVTKIVRIDAETVLESVVAQE